jgi:hypothetical protein
MKKVVFLGMLFAVVSVSFAQTGVIREFTGDVGLKYAGSNDFVPAQPGSQVSQNTVISTGMRSTAIVVIGSNTIAVRPLTRLSLAEISSSNNTENLNVNLQTGRVRVDVKPPSGTRASTTVQTPTATASVRGTSFEMDSRSLSVLEGKVSFAGNSGLPVMVSVGGASEVSNDSGVAVDPAAIAAAELAPPPPVGATGMAGRSSEIAVSAPGDFGLNVIINVRE